MDMSLKTTCEVIGVKCEVIVPQLQCSTSWSNITFTCYVSTHLTLLVSYICNNYRISIVDPVYYHHYCDSNPRACTDMHVRQSEKAFTRTSEITDGGS